MGGMKSMYEMVVMSWPSPEHLTSDSGSWLVPLRDRQSWLMQKAQLSFCSMFGACLARAGCHLA